MRKSTDSSEVFDERLVERKVTLVNHRTGATQVIRVLALTRTKARFMAFTEMDERCAQEPGIYGQYADWHVQYRGDELLAQALLPILI